MQRSFLEHPVFPLLEQVADFYGGLSYTTMHWVTFGSRAINFNTYIYGSIKGTINSMKLVLTYGKVNDAYALLRKYHDSCIINSYAIAYLDEHASIDNFIVQKIDNWLKGREKLPEFNILKQYLERYAKLGGINALLKKDIRYKEIRSRCNDHMHYNFFQCMLANDKDVFIDGRMTYLDQLSLDLKDLFVQHLAYVFTLNDHYMSSTDYIDALDVGIEPEEGSQYFVAPFVQKAFNEIIKSVRPDIADEIKSQTVMKLE